jgi:hypothetical protein
MQRKNLLAKSEKEDLLVYVIPVGTCREKEDFDINKIKRNEGFGAGINEIVDLKIDNKFLEYDIKNLERKLQNLKFWIGLFATSLISGAVSYLLTVLLTSYRKYKTPA